MHTLGYMSRYDIWVFHNFREKNFYRKKYTASPLEIYCNAMQSNAMKTFFIFKIMIIGIRKRLYIIIYNKTMQKFVGKTKWQICVQNYTIVIVSYFTKQYLIYQPDKNYDNLVGNYILFIRHIWPNLVQ